MKRSMSFVIAILLCVEGVVMSAAKTGDIASKKSKSTKKLFCIRPGKENQVEWIRAIFCGNLLLAYAFPPLGYCTIKKLIYEAVKKKDHNAFNALRFLCFTYNIPTCLLRDSGNASGIRDCLDENFDSKFLSLGSRLFYFIVTCSTDAYGKPLIFYAIKNKDVKLVKKLCDFAFIWDGSAFETREPNISAKTLPSAFRWRDENGNSLAHYALLQATEKDEDAYAAILDELSRRYLLFWNKNKKGKDPLDIAFEKKLYKIADVLYFQASCYSKERKGKIRDFILNKAPLSCIIPMAKNEKYIDHMDGEGNTILHYAGMTKRYDLFSALLDCNADGVINNNKRETPFDLLMGDAKPWFKHIDFLLKSNDELKKIVPIIATYHSPYTRAFGKHLQNSAKGKGCKLDIKINFK